MCDCCNCREFQFVPSTSAVLSWHRTNSNSSYSYLRILRRLGTVSRRFALLSLLFLSIVRIPHLTMAAPTQKSEDLTDSTPASSTSERRRPKWVNPCGIDTTAALEIGTEFDMGPMSDADMMQLILVQAQNAFQHTKQFRDEYIRSTFKVGLEEMQKWNKMTYDWLPSREEVPKLLGESLSQDYLNSLNIEETLRTVYASLQKFAVGLEQVVLDQTVYNADFSENFYDAEYKLKAVLCELQVAMLEKGVAPDPDLTRQIMSEQIRDIEDVSLRDLRDWLIFRDYMNGLEYTIQVFSHFKEEAIQKAAETKVRSTSPESQV